MKGQLWSREELMAKYGMPEGGEGDEDEEAESEGPGSVPSTPAPLPPVRQVVEKAQGAARGAAAAAREGLRAAAEKARGLWDAFQARQQRKGQQKQQEL